MEVLMDNNNNIPFVEGFDNLSQQTQAPAPAAPVIPAVTETTEQSFASYAYAPAPAAEAVAVKSSRAPIAITLICMFLAGVLAAGALYFLGNRGTSYERAERSSVNGLATGLSSMFAITDTSESISITITPSREAASLPGMSWLSDLGSLTFDIEGIYEGGDFFWALGMSMLGIDVSMSMWQIGEQFIMQFPEISRYYIVLSEIMDMSAAMQMPDVDLEAVINEAAAIGTKVLDRYFELTKDAGVLRREDVRVGNITKACDVYEIIIDGDFVLDILIVGFEAFLDSDEIMRVFRDIYDQSNAGYEDAWWYQSFDEMMDEAKDEIYSLRPRDIDIEATMLVYISGRDVIKREIKIEEVTISFASASEGSDYVREARVSVGRDGTLRYIEEGQTARSGESTGKMTFSYRDRWDSYAFTIEYKDFKFEKNGLFSGEIEFLFPIPGESFGVEIKLDSTVSGDNQFIKGSLFVLGMRVVDIEIDYRTNTGKRIDRPSMNSGNTLDLDNYDDVMKLIEDFMNWAEGFDLNSDVLYMLEDILWELEYMLWRAGMYDLADLLSDALGGYGWDDWCSGDEYCWCDWCYDYNYGWDDWCSGDEYCWCDYCYDYNYGWDNQDYDRCNKCGHYHYDNWFEDGYSALMRNYYEGFFKVFLGDEWSSGLWSYLSSEFADCIEYLTEYDWLDIFAEYGYDLYERYYDIEEVMWEVDFSNYVNENILYSMDFNDFASIDWESVFRAIFRDFGFSF
jgi:hypothetical protein